MNNTQVQKVECEAIEWREGQWVKFSRRMPRKRFLDFMRLTVALEELQGAEIDAGNIGNYADKFDALLQQLYPILAAQIVSWNWVDYSDPEDEAPPVLPKPTIEILDTLDVYTESMWLIEALSEVVFPKVS